MTEPLTTDRFRALADAYGGTIARWPAETQAAAMAMAAYPAARAILAEAQTLDATLDRWTVAAPSAALRQHVLPRRAAGAWRRARLWWSGVGLAAALAGAAAGSVAAAAVSPVDPPSESATAFGDLGGQEG